MVLCKLEMDPNLILYTKISSKWIIRLNVSAQTLKLLGKKKKKNIAINLYSFWLGSGFLDMTLKVQATEEKNKLHFIKVEKLCASKDIIKEVKILPVELKGKKFASPLFHLTRDSDPEYIKNICTSMIESQSNWMSRGSE